MSQKIRHDARAEILMETENIKVNRRIIAGCFAAFASLAGSNFNR
jgi:hypothetical protein